MLSGVKLKKYQYLLYSQQNIETGDITTSYISILTKTESVRKLGPYNRICVFEGICPIWPFGARRLPPTWGQTSMMISAYM